MYSRRMYVMRDLGIIGLSVILTLILVKNGTLKNLLASVQGITFFGSFFAGIFFTSVFTIAPATVVLAELAQLNSPLEVAFFGGIGALCGDLIIFRFVKDSLGGDIEYLVQKRGGERLSAIFHYKLFKWLIPFLGALIVASPLPDELGLAMMGLSKMKTSLFIPVSFLLNSLGILVIGLIAKMV